jgi:hypothetical protein
MRYFFHVYDGHVTPDLEGMEFADFAAMHAEAVAASGEMLRDLKGKLSPQAEWRMEVADETGRTVLTLRVVQTALQD